MIDPVTAALTLPAPVTTLSASSAGGTVLLDHGAGLFTQYSHLSRIDVKEGDTVAKGARLGESGHTGRVTGPHLHWGAKLFGARVNPEALLALPAWPLPGADARPLN